MPNGAEPNTLTLALAVLVVVSHPTAADALQRTGLRGLRNRRSGVRIPSGASSKAPQMGLFSCDAIAVASSARPPVARATGRSAQQGLVEDLPSGSHP